MTAFSAELLHQVHAHSMFHRRAVEASSVVGCFYCRSMFTPALITGWTDKEQGLGRTALCPQCGVDAILPEQGLGVPLDDTLLEAMEERWFSLPRSVSDDSSLDPIAP